MTTFTINPNCLTSTVLTLAHQMCENKEYSALPILADALEDAECDNFPLPEKLRDTRYPKPWLAHLVASQMDSAPLPENPVDQAELFWFYKHEVFPHYFFTQIAFRFNLFHGNSRIPKGTYVSAHILILTSQHVTPQHLQQVREGLMTVRDLNQIITHRDIESQKAL